MKEFPKVTVVGHPFAPIGRGEDARSAFRAFKAAGLNAPLFDIYKMYQPWPEFVDHLTPELSPEINVYFINGDEVDSVFKHLKPLLPKNAYNIVCPAWELSIYPESWAEQLNRFDEVWAPSKFIYNALKPCISKPMFHIPLASEVRFESFLGRHYFGIPESSFVFLFAFDFLSSIHRKNPFAVARAFYELCNAYPKEDIVLVLKLNHSSQKPEEFQKLVDILADSQDKVLIIDKTLSDNEMKNLMRCSDCFISLHRSEGFGRGISEAMYLGKTVIVTGYSGNMDFVNPDNSYTVDYTLISVENGQYPYWQGQQWAEANDRQAFSCMSKIIESKSTAREIGRRSSLDVRSKLCYSVIGGLYRERISELIKECMRVG